MVPCSKLIVFEQVIRLIKNLKDLSLDFLATSTAKLTFLSRFLNEALSAVRGGLSMAVGTELRL